MNMPKFTESEELMYEVMCAIANANVPIVYKGAMITKLILKENGFGLLNRETQDIDATWAGGTPPSMEKMTESLNDALSGLDLNAVVKREYGIGKSAGFNVFDAKGNIKFSVDIDMRASIDKRQYHYGNVTFEGVTPDNVISDKISAVSTDKVFRRSKDLIDLYALASCITVKSENIRRIWGKENRTIGTFDAFQNRRDDLQHAYEKMQRVESKLEFNAIYNYLSRFLAPFIDAIEVNRTWDSKKGNWMDDVPKANESPRKETGSILKRIDESKRSLNATQHAREKGIRNHKAKDDTVL